MRRGLGLAIAATTLLWAASGAFASGSTVGLAYESAGAKGSPQIWVANGNGSNAHKLTTGGQPSLAPNGGAVAVVPESGHSGVVIYSAAGKVIGKFFDPKRVSAFPLAWSPDSRYLAVALSDVQNLNKIGRSGLALIDVQTGTTTLFVSGVVEGASWSPTGDKLAYGLAKSIKIAAPTNLYEASIGSGHASIGPLTTNGNSLEPVWGKLGIAFDRVKSRGMAEAPLDQIYLLHGGHITQITHVPVGPLVTGLAPVAVSANGRRLVAEYGGTDTSDAYTVDLVTHATHELIVDGQSVTGWGISRDGKRVLIVFGGFEQSPNHGKIESIAWGGGTPTVLEPHGYQPSWDQ